MHMSGPGDRRNKIDLCDPVDRVHALRIGSSWVDLRRGPATAGLREYLLGPDDPLEQGQMDALDMLINRDSRTMSSLAGRLRVNRSTATRAVDRLVTDGLVERFPSPDDGRVVLVRITAEGRRRHAAIDKRRSKAMQQILSEFNSDEREQLATLLERLVSSVDRAVETLGDSSDA
jgi:DNA-binding MarR family transcriptional regulator